MDIISRISKISSKAFSNENECIKSMSANLLPQNFSLAKTLIENARKNSKFSGKSLLTKYNIKSPEGRAVMSLAECLLRVPDSYTAGLLTKEKAKDFMGILGNIPFLSSPAKMAVKLTGAEFVIGETLANAKNKAEEFKQRGYKISYDMLGEGARTKHQAEKYFAAYKQAVGEVSTDDSISVKISALHPKFELLKLPILEVELLPKLAELIAFANQRNVTIVIDAEESRRLDITLILFAKLYEQGLRGFGIAVQAYQKRAPLVLEFLRDLAAEYKTKIPVRLVKGAYWDSEIKYAQNNGLSDYPVFTQKKHTDISYLYCANFLTKNIKYFYPQFGTHNAASVAAILEIGLAAHEFEFQKLFGMGDELHDQIIKLGFNSRIYAPVGGFVDLLSYLIRRLLENGANTSFVNQIADQTKTADMILRAEEDAKNITKPLEIFGKRKNSTGFDLGNFQQVEEIKNNLSKIKIKHLPDTKYNIKNALKNYQSWSRNSPQKRAEILEKIADEFEKQKFLLIKLLMEEGKKTLFDAIGELREAVDFCRYYANQGREILVRKNMVGATGESNEYELQGRGVFVCISPWNFPLAIFTGQIAAALMSGNSVIAKPAEQTPEIAKLAVNIMQKFGAPVQIAIGSGEKVGAALVADPDISGICFTGSTDVAKKINQSVAINNKNIIPIIAETGGQNCMIVDSTALPEQAVDDIITSAFNSAGQRCSALRVCYIQEEIYDVMLDLLKGAAELLVLGSPNDLTTDISEVIDVEAKETLQKHIKKFKNQIIYSGKVKGGNLFAPHIIEISNIAELEREVFGPILHLRKFKAKELEKIINEINSTGYGLTFGIHTRIEGRAREVSRKVHAGNIYVNRNMIGAIVESQPFGGMGLSGTGPKAGGPQYLLRFCHEKVTSINTTAWGGNVDLL